MNGTFNGVEHKFKGVLPQSPWCRDPQALVLEDNHFCNCKEGELMADKLIIYGKVG